MDVLSSIAEARIREAVARGDLDDLPGKGKPLALDDLSRVPDDLRAGYLVCKNANVLPQEVELRKEIVSLSDLIRACMDDGERAVLRRKMTTASLRLETLMDRHRTNPAWREYGDRVRQRLVGR